MPNRQLAIAGAAKFIVVVSRLYSAPVTVAPTAPVDVAPAAFEMVKRVRVVLPTTVEAGV